VPTVFTMVFKSQQPDISCKSSALFCAYLGSIAYFLDQVSYFITFERETPSALLSCQFRSCYLLCISLICLQVPRDITIWQWLFESKASPLSRFPANEVRGFTNALTKERLSYHEVKQCTTQLSTALVKKYGFKEGDTVSLFSPNTIWYPVAMHGVSRVGGIISGASPAYNVEEMTYALKKSNAKYLMTVAGSMEIAAAAAKNAGMLKENVFLLDGSMAGFKTVKDLIEVGKGFGDHGQVKSFNIPPGKKNGDVCAFLSFSSGTTGLPKAVRTWSNTRPRHD